MKKLILILSIPITAFATEWKPVAASIDMAMQIDSGSIVALKDGQRKAWREYIFNKPQDHTSVGKTFTRSIIQSVYDCNNRAIAHLQEVDYDKVVGGNVIDSVSNPMSAVRTKDVVPGSFDEEALNYVCSKSVGHKK